MSPDFRSVNTESDTAAPRSPAAAPVLDTSVTGVLRKNKKRIVVIVAAVVAMILVVVIVAVATGGGSSSPTTGQAIRAAHGPTTVTNGVPSGYTRDEQGVSTAAVNTIQAIAQAGQGRIDMADVRSTMIVAEPGPTLSAALDIESGRDESADVLSLLPAAVTVISFTPDTAQVSVWTVGVGQSEINATGTVSLTQTYSTTDLALVWSGGDWKVQEWAFRQGPRPEDTSYPAADSALSKQLTSGYYTFYID